MDRYQYHPHDPSDPAHDGGCEFHDDPRTPLHDDSQDEGGDGQDDPVMDEEEEARLAAQLQSELETLRNQTETALKTSWAEVERLQREGSASSDRVAALERELERLQAARRAEEEAGAVADDPSSRALMRYQVGPHATEQVNFGDDGYSSTAASLGPTEVGPVSTVESGSGGPEDDARSMASGGIFRGGVGGGNANVVGGVMDDLADVMNNPEQHGEQQQGQYQQCGNQQHPPQQQQYHYQQQEEEGGGGMMKRRPSMGLFGMGGGGQAENDHEADQYEQQQAPQQQEGSGGRMKRRPSIGLFGIGGGGGDNQEPSMQGNLQQPLGLADASQGGTLGDSARRNSCFGRMEDSTNRFDFDPSRDMPGGQATVEGGVGAGMGVVGADGIRADMLNQLASLENDKRQMVEELETKLRGKEAAIETLERTTAAQAEAIAGLQTELEDLRRQSEDEERAARADAAQIESEIERNELRAAELEEQVAEAERTLSARREREDVLRSELEEMEERVRRAEEQAAAYVSELEERLRRAEASRAKYEEENAAMSRKTDDALESLKADLVDYLPADKSEELIAELMDQFALLREKEEQLGEVLVSRIQERQEVLAAIQKMGEVQKRADAGLQAVADMLERFRASMKSLEEDDASDEPVFTPGSREAERMRRRHEAAVTGLEKAAAVQERVRKSLKQVEEELMDRLALLDWNKNQFDENQEQQNQQEDQDEKKTEGKEAEPLDAATGRRPSRRDSGGDDVMKKAERVQDEAKEQLREAREELETALAEIEGKDPSKKKKKSRKTHAETGQNLQFAAGESDPDHEIDSDEDDLDKLESELEKKEAKIASLVSAKAEHERTVESLRRELDRLQASTREESNASLEVMNKLQREVHDIVQRVAEKDCMIAGLAAMLEKRKAEEEELRVELDGAREERQLAANSNANSNSSGDNLCPPGLDCMPGDMPDFPQDLGHVGL